MMVGAWSQLSPRLAGGWPAVAGGKQGEALGATEMGKGFGRLDEGSGVEKLEVVGQKGWNCV